MGFREGAYAMIWQVEDKGNYALAKISTSKKDKQSGEYKTDFSSGFVKFIGSAYKVVKNIPLKTRIKLGPCEVTNNYDKEKKKEYVNFAVFECETVEGSSMSNKKESAKVAEETNDENLPF